MKIKHLKLTFLLTVLMSMTGIKAYAHDFAVANADGVTIYYVKTSDKEVAVSFQGSSPLSYSEEYSGDVAIPESVTYDGKTYSVRGISEHAFFECTGLTSVNIPNSVFNIGVGAFLECTGLTSVNIPIMVMGIGEGAFAECTGLKTIVVDEENCFFDSREGCNAIIETATNTLITGCQNTTIPNSVTSIGDAFFGCTGLTSITIPNSVTSIGYNAFSCSGLTSISIPNSVTSIGKQAFNSCISLTSVTIGNSVTSIGNDAFNLCRGLTSITIPSSVTSIGNSAFDSCSGLTSVIIGNSVTSIGKRAFYDCEGLTSVTIPGSVTSIGDHAFALCSGLLDMFCYAKNVPTTGSDAFNNSNIANATLHVPAGSVGAYQAADQWKNFKEIVAIIEPTDITASDNVIYLDAEDAVTGTQKSLSIKMKNTAAIRGFQFNMTLPEGVTPATYSNGTIMCSLSDARRPEGDQHTISVSKQDDGSYKFLCGSLANETFTGTDGEVLTLKVNIAGDMKAGNYPITLSSMKLTETNIDNYYETAEVVSKLTVSDCVIGDITGDGTVDVSDYIGVANHILGKTPAGFNKQAADVNDDGVVDVADYIGVANIILTGSIYGNSGSASRPDAEDEEPVLEAQ